MVAEALCGGTSVTEVCRRNGISESLYWTWHDRALRAVGGQQPGGYGSFERTLARRAGTE